MKNAYALIMAGGAGTRLWPLSRMERPKPVLALIEEHRSMFQISVDRLQPLFQPEQIFVVANEQLSALLSQQSPEIPAENFIIEPEGKDTAPAIGLGAIHINHRDPDAIMAVLTADHHIADTVRFRSVLEAACKVAQSDDSIVTLGIAPTYPATGFGYIERGDHIKNVGSARVYTLKRFTEKPREILAREFVASGQYSWNSGMFIWSTGRLLHEIETHIPELHEKLAEIEQSIGTEAYAETINTVWPTIPPKRSIDKALMEHLQEGVNVIPVEMGWQDIGNFKTLHDILNSEDEESDNVAVGYPPILRDVRKTLVMSEKPVAILGLEDVVVIDTDDILLVCRLDRAQEVKKLVEDLRNSGRNEYL